MPEPIVNVVCIKWGTIYNGPYVNNLFSMVQRHLTLPHRFVCFTDNDEGFLDGIESFPLPFGDLTGGMTDGSWNKVSLFAPRLADLKGAALFLDLDLLVVDNIDCFFDYKEGEFVIIHDWLRLDQIEGNSSVFRFDIGGHTELLEYFLAHQESIRANFRGDQAYTCHRLNETGELNYWPDQWCLSFKRHCLPAWPMTWFQTPKPPPGAKIIVFHGAPKPDQAIRGGRSRLRYIRPAPWVEQHWHS